MGTAYINFIADDVDITDFSAGHWAQAEPVLIDKYWSGEAAPISRQTQARLLWSREFLYCLFDTAVGEPLVISSTPDTANKTIGLWDRDVCEIFIAPDTASLNKYFEFEVAPTGEWVDLAIEVTPAGRNTDIEYRSNMQVAVQTEDGRTLTAMAIPFSSLGLTPNAGDRWAGNLFRCVGSGPSRGYLAWRPTLTEVPNFHVPESFGIFEFAL